MGPLSFLEGLRKKYASDEATSPGTHGSQRTEKPTEWGGKAVEEVGFDKIRQQQSMLNELRIVLLDGLCIAGATAAPQREDEQRRIEALRGVKEICPKIRELDLSRNLLERWDEVMDTCLQLDELNTLKVK
ncbi:MAG: hypothetical protein M1832_005193 [Thelocarpon impressellum]|nr:MAG: hypothetical protein M1832_005193 [Thelocarpon impressellum]